MLNNVIFNVLNHALDGNIESVDFYDKGYKVQIMTKSKMRYADFIRKTSYVISKNDIIRVDDSDEEDLTFPIDVTEAMILKFINYTKTYCLCQFEDMRRISRF